MAIKKVVEAPEVVKMDALVVKTLPSVSAIALKPVTSQALYLQTGSLLTQLKGLLDKIEAERKAIVDPLNKVIKHVNDKCRPFKDAVQEKISEAKQRMIDWDDAQRMLAMKAAEKEAKKIEKKGDVQLAEAIRERAESTGGAGFVPGITYKTLVKGRVVNETALLRAVADGKAPAGLFELNQTALDKLARSPAEMPAGTERYEERIAAVSAL